MATASREAGTRWQPHGSHLEIPCFHVIRHLADMEGHGLRYRHEEATAAVFRHLATTLHVHRHLFSAIDHKDDHLHWALPLAQFSHFPYLTVPFAHHEQKAHEEEIQRHLEELQHGYRHILLHLVPDHEQHEQHLPRVLHEALPHRDVIELPIQHGHEKLHRHECTFEHGSHGVIVHMASIHGHDFMGYHEVLAHWMASLHEHGADIENSLSPLPLHHAPTH